MACEILRSIGFIWFRLWPRHRQLFKFYLMFFFSALFQSHSVFTYSKYCFSETSCFETIGTESYNEGKILKNSKENNHLMVSERKRKNKI